MNNLNSYSDIVGVNRIHTFKYVMTTAQTWLVQQNHTLVTQQEIWHWKKSKILIAV